MNPLQSLAEYELFIYTLSHTYLASTHPHHKHIPPDIKHNRIPAPGLSFTRPNLPFLIEEIERDLLNTPHDIELPSE